MDEIRLKLADYFVRSAVLLERWNQDNHDEPGEPEWVEDFTYWYFARTLNFYVGSEVDERVLAMAERIPTGLVQLITGNRTPLGRRRNIDG